MKKSLNKFAQSAKNVSNSFKAVGDALSQAAKSIQAQVDELVMEEWLREIEESINETCREGGYLRIYEIDAI